MGRNVNLKDPKVLARVDAPTMVFIRYHNGSASAQPGAISRRLVLITDVAPTWVAGCDFSRNGEYRRFSRAHVLEAEVLGTLIPVMTV